MKELKNIDVYLRRQQIETPSHDWERWNALSHARQVIRWSGLLI